MKQPKIVVVGSINMDMVTNVPRFPGVGETILGTDFQYFMGGKGANQAIAAVRLGGEVSMIGAVGDDGFGYQMLSNLESEGIVTDGVKTLSHLPSGMANITISEGENIIVVISGANFGLKPADVTEYEHLIADADVVLSQLEIPMDCVLEAAKLAHKHGKPFVLNPAPAQRVPKEILELTTLLTPNAYELALSLGLSPELDPQELIKQAPCPVLMTIGSKGAVYNDERGHLHHVPSFKVSAIDSTGAGDTFNGAFSVFRSEGIEEAVRKACAAAALSTTKEGAQSGMPTKEELDAFLAQ